MLYGTELLEGGGMIGFWLIEESQEELLSMLCSKHDIDRELDKFKSPKRCLEFLSVRLILQHLLGNRKTIAYHPNGAPFLTDNSYNISISHTGIYVAVILHPSKKVSIDVERIRDKVLRVKHKYLSQNELDFVEKDNALIHLTLMWCSKEAVYKILGRERVDIINHIKISPFIPYLDGNIDIQELCTQNQEKFVVNYKVSPDICTVWIVKD